MPPIAQRFAIPGPEDARRATSSTLARRNHSVHTPSPPMGPSRKNVFDRELKDHLCDLDANFSETSPLLFGFRKSGVVRGSIIVLAIEAVMRQRKSSARTKSAIRLVLVLVRFFLDGRTGEKEHATLTGGSPLVLIHDYLEQAASRGGKAPIAINHALGCWAAAIQIDWPLGRALISPAASVEATVPPNTHQPCQSRLPNSSNGRL